MERNIKPRFIHFRKIPVNINKKQHHCVYSNIITFDIAPKPKHKLKQSLKFFKIFKTNIFTKINLFYFCDRQR